MFKGSRRRAPQAQPLTRETAHPNAATAAATAASAVSRRGSNASLSSAAAAAALRARPMSPTNVAEVQSKRVHRRNSSLGSNASRDRSRTREMQRSPSVSSMMERTFRSPSPGRSPAPRERYIPPVPSLPSPSQVPTERSPKSQTIQTQPFQTASQKLKATQQQGTWFGPAKVPSEPRPGSVSPSINFSYPRGRMQSPSPEPSSPTSDQALVYDANSRRMVTRGELLARSQSSRNVQDQPVKKKKQTVSRSGSHLSKGTVGRTQAPALQSVEPIPDDSVIDATTTEAPKKNKKKKKKAKSLSEEEPQDAVVDELYEDDVMTDRPKLAKKPSIVREEPELEEEADGRGGQPADDTEGYAEPVLKKKKSASKKAKTPESKQAESVRRTRVQSESPARSAHFAASSTDQLVVKHEPPPRSLSPRKSALKLSSRGVSPSDDGSEASGRNLSPFPKDDAAAARKKAFRVSWDDKSTVVVGEANEPVETDSPILPSPQAVKKPWHSIVTKYTKKDAAVLDDEETMSPRPALPLFGSVREKKAKEPEERPLVRPSEAPRLQTGLDSVPADVGLSGDAVIGSTTSPEQSSKNEANISKTREPLPSAKPSAESAENNKNDDFSSDDEELLLDTPDVREASNPLATQAGMDEKAKAEDAEALAEGAPEQDPVPTISISQPSPNPQVDRIGEATAVSLDVPGDVPEDGATDGSVTPVVHSAAEDESDDSIDSTPTRPVDPDAGSTPLMDDIAEEEEETESCSVYSDAYEDLEGDGFQSLDAVLTTPTSEAKTARKLYEKPTETAQEETPKPPTVAADATDATAMDFTDAPDDWEKAKSYWRSLTSEKRRQLEREAMDEAHEEADTDTPKAKPKPKKKTTNGKAAKSSQANDSPTNDRSYQIQPGTKWTGSDTDLVTKRNSTLSKASGAAVAPKLRQSMRSQEKAKDDTPVLQSGSMRKSMRSGGPSSTGLSGGSRRRSRSAEPEITTTAKNTSMPRTLRSMASNGDADDNRPSLRQAARPASYHPSASGTDLVKGHKRTGSGDGGSASSVFGRAGMKNTLRRRGSDSSESSFTRARPRTGDDQGFRRSMRGSMRDPPATSDGTRNDGRFSLRSMSPPALGFRRNSVSSLPAAMPTGMAAGRMRQSLRSESTDNLASKKRFSGFGRSPPTRKGKKPLGGSGSRFADSSDEEDGGRPMFSSRFADSSDEDEAPASPQKGKGFARQSMRSTKSSNGAAAAMDSRSSMLRVGSPDLDDSDGGITNPKRTSLANQSNELRGNRSGRGTLMPSPALAAAGSDTVEGPRPGSARRGSFMSILRRKKDPTGKVSRDLGESAARRDTKLERSAGELEMVRRNSNSDGIRTSWPLPEDEYGSEVGNAGEAGDASANITRPSTAGGPAVAKSSKSKFLRRRSTSQGMVGLGYEPSVPVEPVPAIPDQHKKKKFGGLRKMFGIQN